jgi:hypothetical protein
MIAFHELFPELAQRECRSVTPLNHDAIPNRKFFFVEAYCVEPRCDCRRVMIHVVDAARRDQVATISYGFEPPEPRFDDVGQVFLDPLNPQSDLSDALLELFEDMIKNDREYHERLVRHYEMWKQVVDDPRHPAQEKIRSAEPGYGIPPGRRRTPVRRQGPKIGPNAPCPCGSGRKLKKCCRTTAASTPP